MAVNILFTPAERAKYVGIVGSASALAGIAGPALGGYITDTGVQFFKYIGSTIGSAVLGTIMSSSLANGIMGVDFSILPESIARTLKDPSVLQNKDTIAQIQANIPAEIMTEFEKVITQTKQVLSHSIHEVFIVCIIIAAVSLVISFFMKEIILAKKTKS